MPDYQELYFKLFAAMADAVEHMENENYGLAVKPWSMPSSGRRSNMFPSHKKW